MNISISRPSYRVILLNPILPDQDLKSYPSLSVATNVWLTGLASIFSHLQVKFNSYGFIPEPPWPYGRVCLPFRIFNNQSSFVSYTIGYLNLPFFRFFARLFTLLGILFPTILNSKRFKTIPVIISFTCLDHPLRISPEILAAQIVSFILRVDYVAIVGDGFPPMYATKYLYLAASARKLIPRSKPSMHFEGGVNISNGNKPTFQHLSYSYSTKVLLYCGSLGSHGGITQFITSVNSLDLPEDLTIHIYGQGDEKALSCLSAGNPHIKIFGLVDQSTLHDACINCYAFINPRPLDYQPNLLNFPSKILHYLAYSKPILSTMSPGIPEQYDNILTYYDESSLSSQISTLLNLPFDDYLQHCRSIQTYALQNTWMNRSAHLDSFFFETSTP